MPIKPENRARYPKDWKRIAERTHRRRFSPKYQIVIDAIDAARKGEATTPHPSPSPQS